MKFLTFLNSGCISLCENMLVSAKKVGLNPKDFFIACLDNESKEHFRDYENTFLYFNHNLKEYQNWTFDENSGFREIVKHKWKLIKKIYENNKKLCWVDTDIVFIKNPLDRIQNNEKILFQTDYPGSVLCTGFMVFNQTNQCDSLINECSQNEKEDDQLLLNKIALSNYMEHIGILNPDLFPNGNEYYKNNNKKDAYIVHKNWMMGTENKINKFKEEGLWYI